MSYPSLYDDPLLYDIAFSWSPRVEVDFYEEVFRRHAGRVRRVLELGCGTGRLMAELARRGYEVDGIDVSPCMVRYANERFMRLGLRGARAFLGDMACFTTSKTYDAALCTLNTFSHLLTRHQARSHLLSVALALRPGGVYCIDLTLAGRRKVVVHRWVSRAHGVTAYCTWRRIGPRDPRRGTVREVYEFTYVWPDGSRRVLRGYLTMRAWTLREFRELVESTRVFSIEAWYDNSFDPDTPITPTESSERVVVVLVRRLKPPP